MPDLTMATTLDERAWKACGGLPIELVEKICLYAAEADRKSAHTMAFVSRRICKLTANARWRIIAITSISQFMAFVREVHAIPDDEYNVLISNLGRIDPFFKALRLRGIHQIIEVDTWEEKKAIYDIEEKYYDPECNEDIDSQIQTASKELRKMRRKCVISFPPSGEPHENIRHLYMDLPDLSDSLGQCMGSTNGWDAWLAILHKARLSCQNCRDITDDVFVPGCLFHYKFHGLFSRELGNFKLDHLSLGTRCLSLFDRTHCREITLVYDLSESSMDFYNLQSLSHLERFHIIGIDSQSKLSGCAPPWDLLQGVNFEHPLNLTHLRYDTRKFSFKPAEIFATRLRPLLQEMTFKPNDLKSLQKADENAYSHSGPRHSAPIRNSHVNISRTRSSLIPLQLMTGDKRAKYMLEVKGVRYLDFLQFAWDPMNASEKRAEDIPLHQRARYSNGHGEYAGVDETGGWPRERRGAWTERSDRDVAPSFEMELREAITSLYGWHAPGIEPAAQFVTRVDALPLKERKTFFNVAFIPDGAGEMVQKMKFGLKEFDRKHLKFAAEELRQEGFNVADEDLQYGVRAPESLIHLGGKVPFEVEERLALFEDRARGGKGAWP